MTERTKFSNINSNCAILAAIELIIADVVRGVLGEITDGSAEGTLEPVGTYLASLRVNVKARDIQSTSCKHFMFSTC